MALLALLAPIAHAQEAWPPVVDTHVHYNRESWSVYSPEEALELMQQAGITWALVSSTPDDATLRLYELAPEMVVPVLRPYRFAAGSPQPLRLPPGATGAGSRSAAEIAPDGVLDPGWRQLFLDYSDRVMLGSDTWLPRDWTALPRTQAVMRSWLQQLPPEVAAKLAYATAEQLFRRPR